MRRLARLGVALALVPRAITEVAVVGDTCGRMKAVENSSSTVLRRDEFARCPQESSCERTDDDPDELVCAHKPLLPMGALDVTSMVLVFFSTALAAGGGIGGGGLLVPIFILV